MNVRFWLTIFAVVMIFVLFKMATETYYFEFRPTIIDKYKKWKDTGEGVFEMFVSKDSTRMFELSPAPLEINSNYQSDDEM